MYIDAYAIGKLIKEGLINLFVVVLISALIPGALPISVLSFWTFSNDVPALAAATMPVLIWGAVATFVLTTPSRFETASSILAKGICISLLAGVLEELTYRWLRFLCATIGMQVINFIFFGFAGFGILEWFYLTIMGPLVNFFSFHGLEDELLGGEWIVGAAIVMANSQFRDAHKYLGWIGYVNSWFLGLFLFWVTFNHGLPAAILIHVLYDLCVFSALALKTAVLRKHILR